MIAFNDGKMTQLLDKPIYQSFRIDLAADRYCSEDCTETRPIYRVAQTGIVLDYLETPDHKGTERIEVVNRESGAYHFQLWFDGETTLTKDGSCSPSQFSGFPKRKF